jgi:hypothetical protein
MVDNLLSHEVVPHIPTDLPVQCFGHDIVNPKVHALRRFLKGRSVATCPPASYKRTGCDALRRLGRFALRRVLGGMGEIAQRGSGAVLTRYWRGIDARLCLHNPGAGMTVGLEVFLNPDFSSIE